MMDCTMARSFVDAWEKGENGPEGAAAFAEHLSACPRCSRSYGALLPLMLRDASISGARAEETAWLREAVMERVRKEKPRAAFPLAAMAAAAAAIFIIGMGVGIIAFRSPASATVRFVLDAPQASSVHLVGDFSSWNTSEYEMRRTSPDGPWEITVRLKKDQMYVYNFVIDGEKWIPDPKAEANIDDGFGGLGSLLRL